MVPRASAVDKLDPVLAQDPIYISLQNQLAEAGHAPPRATYLLRMQDELTKGIADVIMGNATPSQVVQAARDAVLAE
jgi:hypothetical protein